MTLTFLFVAAFLACAVEAVEAATVVVAVGLTRSWSSSLRGVGFGVAALAAVVGALGPALTQIPLDPLRLVVGGLLLVFGLGWLRKAILRASGYKSLHDEAAAFERQIAQASGAAGEKRGWMGGDSYAFTLAFKAVLLEGLEVAFIVLTFGANAHEVPLAALAAAAAIAVVVGLAAIVRGPLSRVPENTIKFAVGVMLTSFGSFWGAEGAGAHWPGSDASLAGIIPAVAVLSLGTAAYLRGVRQGALERGATRAAAS